MADAMPKASVATLTALESLWTSGKHSDVTIKTASRSFNCHKLILSTVSPFFDAMFESGMLESHKNVVDMTLFPDVIMETVLKFLYTGNVLIEKEELRKLYKDAVAQLSHDVDDELAASSSSSCAAAGSDVTLCACDESCREASEVTLGGSYFWRTLYDASVYFQLEQVRQYCTANLARISEQFVCCCVYRRCACALTHSFGAAAALFALGQTMADDVLRKCAAEVVRKEVMINVRNTPDRAYWKSEYYALPADMRLVNVTLRRQNLHAAYYKSA